MKSFTKYAVTGLALASANAFAGIDLPSTGNGELTLFVRDLSTLSAATPRIAAIDLNVNLDDILSQAQIQATVVPGDAGEYETRKSTPFDFTYSLPADIRSDARLAQFLSVSSAAGYDYAIVAGDSSTTGAVGERRWLTTSAEEVTVNGVANGSLGTIFMPVAEEALQFESTVIDAASGFSVTSKFGVDGYSSVALINGATRFPWATAAVGEAANLFVFASAGGGSGLLSRVYQGLDIRLNMNGTLEVLGGGEPPAVPLPAAVWLFGSALAGIGALSRRRKLAAA